MGQNKSEIDFKHENELTGCDWLSDEGACKRETGRERPLGVMGGLQLIAIKEMCLSPPTTRH